MTRISTNIFVLFFTFWWCLAAWCVEVESDLTDEEEDELSLDESVTKAERKRLELLFDNIKLSLMAEDYQKAAELYLKILPIYNGRDNLTNLRPQPFYVFLNYSHPPVLQRIQSLSN